MVGVLSDIRQVCKRDRPCRHHATTRSIPTYRLNLMSFLRASAMSANLTRAWLQMARKKTRKYTTVTLTALCTGEFVEGRRVQRVGVGVVTCMNRRGRACLGLPGHSILHPAVALAAGVALAQPRLFFCSRGATVPVQTGCAWAGHVLCRVVGTCLRCAAAARLPARSIQMRYPFARETRHCRECRGGCTRE